MLTLRQRIFIITGIIITIILAIVLIILWQRKQNNDQLPEEVGGGSVEEIMDELISAEPQVAPEAIRGTMPQNADPDEVLAKQMARLFTERFMTYSNQNDNRHVNDALKLATASMSGWIEAQTLEKSNQYQGYTTRVLSTSVREKGADTMTIGISVQQEARTATNSELSQRNARVDMVKQNGAWLVSGFYWE